MGGGPAFAAASAGKGGVVGITIIFSTSGLSSKALATEGRGFMIFGKAGVSGTWMGFISRGFGVSGSEGAGKT